MWKRTNGGAYSGGVKRAALFVLLALGASGCHQNRQTEASPPVLPLEQVVAHPESYARRLVALRGCYIHEFERSTLQPCDNERHDNLVWVEPVKFTFKTGNNVPPELLPKELQSDKESDVFPFPYDEARSKSAWKELTKISSNPVPVTVVGLFETVAPNKANPSPVDWGHGFGHLGQYEHRLIVVDVVETKQQ
jgi:hypothetical protein